LFAWNGERTAAPAAIPAALPGLLPLATEAEILSRAPVRTEIYRFGPQPEIVVLHFVSLSDQASMFNRAAALLERAGYPHDRLVDDNELDRRIRASGDTPERVYYGHDYRASDLVRFFCVGRWGRHSAYRRRSAVAAFDAGLGMANRFERRADFAGA